MNSFEIKDTNYPDSEFEYLVDFAQALVVQNPNASTDFFLEKLAKYRHFKRLGDNYQIKRSEGTSIEIVFQNGAFAVKKVFAVIN